MITWKCEICGEERPDEFIAVTKRDFSERFNMPAGQVMFNCKHCIDKPDCVTRSKVYSPFTTETDDGRRNDKS